MVALGILSTYPPTQCGLATFSSALRENLLAGDPDSEVTVVRVPDGPPGPSRPEVVAVLDQEDFAPACAALNAADAVVMQHEYGIYPGRDGESVTAVLEAVERPVIAVLHTVLTNPSPHQRSVMDRVIGRADRLVVLSATAAERLVATHPAARGNVTVIPHGADVSTAPPRRAARSCRVTRPTILTWGLIGPGKGIERAIDAVAALRSGGVEAEYHVVGQTHPKVRQRDGESYRDALRDRAHARGVADLVRFTSAYEDRSTLLQTVEDADVVLLPYESREQVTSGVLIEAVAARRPVVATAFPHAVELLATGAGRVVPHGDVPAMTRALREVLVLPGAAADMTACAARIAPTLAWPAVAAQYRRLAESLTASAARIAA